MKFDEWFNEKKESGFEVPERFGSEEDDFGFSDQQWDDVQAMCGEAWEAGQDESSRRSYDRLCELEERKDREKRVAQQASYAEGKWDSRRRILIATLIGIIVAFAASWIWRAFGGI